MSVDASIAVPAFIVSLFVIAMPSAWYYLKNKKQTERISTKQIKMLEEHIVLLQEKNKSVNLRFDQLENEILDLSQKIERFSMHKPSEKRQGEPFDKEEPFEKAIRYRQFLQKNHDVVKLLSDGHTTSQVAKILNKSIREIEMVHRLLS